MISIKPKFVSLNIKVFLFAIFMSMIPMAIIGTLLYQKALEIVREKQETASFYIFKNISENITYVTDYAHSLSLFILQNQDVRKTLMAESMTEQERLRHQNQVAKSLMFYTGQNHFVKSIFIHGKNGLVLSAGGLISDGLGEEQEKQLEVMKGKSFWTGTGERDQDGNVEYLTLMRSIQNTANLKETLGTQWINIPITKTKKQFQDYIDTYPGYIALIDSQGKILLSAGETEPAESDIKDVRNAKNLPFINSGKNTLVYGIDISDTGWMLMSGLDTSELLAENHRIRSLLLLGIAVSTMLCFWITFIFARSILRPLRLLTNKIVEVKEDNYNVQLEFESNDEIGILSRQFNTMTKRMNELINEVLKGKMLQTEAELNALQAQVDPHFLYNNLDTAYWMSRLEKAEKTGKVVLAIADLYRLTVNFGHRLISVETEIRYMEDYIVIQELRVADLIQFHIEIQDGVKKWATMRFVIQPLVENAIQHGVLPTGREGHIYIRIYRQDTRLYFEVEDDGETADIEKMKKMLEDIKSEEKKGMAIRGIAQRIKLQFGEDYGLFFEEAPNGGTIARVIQPLVEYENME